MGKTALTLSFFSSLPLTHSLSSLLHLMSLFFPLLTCSGGAAVAGRQSFTSLFQRIFVEMCGGSASVLCGLMIRVLELQRGLGLSAEQEEREQQR